MTYPAHLLPTAVVGSYPQPDWLVDRAALLAHGVPRTRANSIWRVADPLLEQVARLRLPGRVKFRRKCSRVGSRYGGSRRESEQHSYQFTHSSLRQFGHAG